jgi:hypothetical protein
VSLVVLVMSWPRAADAAGIARAYSPDVTSAALGGDLVVNSDGVAGLGLFRMTLDDGSSSAAVCIQADVSHSAAASYHPAAPAYDTGALDASTTTTTASTSTSTSTTVARTTTLPGPTSSTTVAPANPATGNSGRPVVRVGAFLFALGSIATYVASGTRRNAVREVDLDGHDI